MIYGIPDVGKKIYRVTVDRLMLPVVEECRVHRANKDSEQLITPVHAAYENGNLRGDAEICVKLVGFPKDSVCVVAEQAKNLFLDHKNAILAAIGNCHEQAMERMERVQLLVQDI